MALRIEHSVPLSELCTFRMGGMAKEIVTVTSEEDLVTLFGLLKADRKWFVLGGGSNTIFPDGDFKTLVIRVGMDSIRTEESDAGIVVTAGAGASWDVLVAYTVEQGLSGIEALSAIPGCVGATPIQNVGAYGSEVKDTIVAVRAYDTVEKKFVTFTNAECEFAYRDSMFKHVPHRYIITEVSYKMSKEKPKTPNYSGVAEYFEKRGIREPDLHDIRSAIIAIRATKLPDPKVLASVGSFFKNPIIAKSQADALKEQYPTLAVFPVSETLSKIGAGSLIDTMGWKGKSFGAISIYPHNALVLVNEGGATKVELEKVVSAIVFTVKEKYGIELSVEPELVNEETLT